jgi:hypothetical protein
MAGHHSHAGPVQFAWRRTPAPGQESGMLHTPEESLGAEGFLQASLPIRALAPDLDCSNS